MRGCAVVICVCALACRGDATSPAPPPSSTAERPAAIRDATLAITPTDAAAGDAAPAPAPADAAPDNASAVASGPFTITSTGVGPLNASTPPDQVAVRARVPGLDVSIEHHEQKASYERPDYDSIWLVDGRDRVAELVIESGAIYQIAIDSGTRFATTAGITVGATGNVLTNAYPDLTCQFAMRHRRAGAIQDARVLACETRALPSVSFELTAGKLKDRGKIRPAAIATHAIESIVWLAPDRIQALPRASRMISPNGVGPFTTATPMQVDAVRAAFPGFAVVTGTRSYGEGETDDTIDILSGGEIVLRLINEDGHLSEILVESSGFATPSGITVGSTVRELASKERNVSCESSMPYDDTWELWCTTPGQPHVQFVIGDDSIRREGNIAVRAIARRTIAQILWLPRS
jgi:hypothetical protein